MQDEVVIKKQNAIKAHKGANPETQRTLEKLFPELFGDITERVQNFKDICEIAGVLESDYTGYGLTDDQENDMLFKKLKLITRVLNGNDETTGQPWKADFSNRNQGKYWAWMEYGSSGFAFDVTRYNGTLTCTGLGSRLLFKSPKLAKFAYLTFKEDYDQFATI